MEGLPHVVFRYPLDPNRDFVKRVVGLPCETIEMRQTTVYVNGAPLTEPYTRYEDYVGYRHGFGPFTVPQGAVFMMGDNRDNSQDSRVWGPLPVENIRGKAFVIHWSWKDEGWGVRWNRVARLLD
ncbi:MAG: signal peptidase I [Nitrospinae bacterium]|nr:signal peptidase I [Nitrospinota bacterium]